MASKASQADRVAIDKPETDLDRALAMAEPKATSKAQGKPKKPKELRTRYSGAELREELQARLPALKAKRVPASKIITGRPSTYTPELGNKILELMANGMTLTEACDELGLYRSTVYHWAEKNPSFATTLARAKHALAEHAFSQAHAIPKSLYESALRGEEIDGPMVAAARLYTDSLKWYAERLNPRDYAQQSKQSIELTGKNGGPIQTAAFVFDSRDLSIEARDALRQALLSAKPNEINEIEGEAEEVGS
jgi:hypothetical protein